HIGLAVTCGNSGEDAKAALEDTRRAASFRAQPVGCHNPAFRCTRCGKALWIRLNSRLAEADLLARGGFPEQPSRPRKLPTSAPGSEILRSLSQRRQNASIFGKRCAVSRPHLGRMALSNG